MDRPLNSAGPVTSCAIDGALVYSDSGFAAGTVLVEGRHIAAVAWSAAECEALRARAETVVAAQGHWLIPGLVDGHAHGYAALLRGTQNSLPLELASRGIVSSPSLTLLFTRECEHNEGTKNDPCLSG